MRLQLPRVGDLRETRADDFSGFHGLFDQRGELYAIQWRWGAVPGTSHRTDRIGHGLVQKIRELAPLGRLVFQGGLVITVQ